jgi:hypothetical protein|tara:strand:- start:83 stop:478 length:396 start_codon:yes stop_codon:yes gene_type:complete
MKSQLLCTFTNKNDIDKIVDEIKQSYSIVFNKIYVLQNENDVDELICTYNVSGNNVDFNSVKSTISLHRKKHSNTLYTINALNEVISSLNGGVIDSDFLVPWNDYENTLLVTNTDGLNIINTRIYKIIKID